MIWRRRSLLLAVPLLMLAAHVQATMMLKMELTDLTDRAGTIFRGTVVDVEQGTVEAGGGQLPAVTYRFKVEKLYKGEASEQKGDEAIIELRMFGSIKPAQPDPSGVVNLTAVTEMPEFQQGQEYLLFASQASAIGLCAPIGLGQGAFKVFQVDGTDMVVNEFNNAGLGINGDGPVPLSALDAKLRELLVQ